MIIPSHLRLRPRTTVFVVAAALLAWLVVSRSLAAYLADAAPGAALWLDSRQPEALVNLADRAVATANVNTANANTANANDGNAVGGSALPQSTDKSANSRAGTDKGATAHVNAAFSAFERVGVNRSINRPAAPADAAAVRDWAETALSREPLNARALRVLGELAEAQGNDPDVAKLMREAGRLSLHEGGATYWLMRNSADSNDYKSAVRYADILLRTNPESYPFVVPVLAQICETKEGAALLETVLAGDPPWRSQFISVLPNDVADARTPLGLLLAMRNDRVPLSADDLKPYIDRLIAHKFYSLAYYTWLQFLPTDELSHAGLLFNGNFERLPSGLPFDWTIREGAGVTIDIVPRPDKVGEHALLVDFEFGRVDYHSVTELIMLAPGTYRFNGQYQGQLVGPRGLKWRVVCAGGAVTNGGESEAILGKTTGWRDLTFTFTVPPTDCAAQYVQLDLDARMASETLVQGSVLFDDLQISHAQNSAASGG